MCYGSLLSILLTAAVAKLLTQHEVITAYVSESIAPFVASAAGEVASTSSATDGAYFLVSSSGVSSRFAARPPMSAARGSQPDRSSLPCYLSQIIPTSSFAVTQHSFIEQLGGMSLPALKHPAVTAGLPVIRCLIFSQLSRSRRCSWSG